MIEWVLDNSVALAWCFDDERTAETDTLFERLIAKHPAAAPQIWPLELANALTVATRKKRITHTKRLQFLTLMENAPIEVDIVPLKTVFAEIVPLAEQHQLTSYDASYLELALRLKVPLASLDQPLRRAAIAMGVTLL